MIKREGFQLNSAALNNHQFLHILCIRMSNQSNSKALTCIIKTATVATVDSKII